MRSTTPTGYRVALGQGLEALLHADGALSILDAEGRAADFDAGQVEQLAALLSLGAGLRGRARRRRAAASYALGQQAETIGQVEA